MSGLHQKGSIALSFFSEICSQGCEAIAGFASINVSV